MMQRFSALMLEVSVSCTVVRNYCGGIIAGRKTRGSGEMAEGTNVPIGVTDLMLKILSARLFFER